jgi:hypothetical protein
MIMNNESNLSRAAIALVFLILATVVPSTIVADETMCPVYDLRVAERSKFEVETYKDLPMVGGTMLCTFPTNLPDPNVTFPLISFGHGGNAGGLMTGVYEKFMREVASSGFVVCAPRRCTSMCPAVFETYLLNAITAANYFSEEGVLPKLNGKVGVSGHSIAGVSALKSCYKEHVSDYGIKSAVLFDMTGVLVANRTCSYNWWNVITNQPCGADARLERVDPEVPMLFLAADGDKDPNVMIWDHTLPTVDTLLISNPKQPLVVASIKDMTHEDLINELYPWPLKSYPALLKSVEYIIGFFTYTLKSEQLNACDDKFRTLLGAQLECNSMYYDNQLCHADGEFDLFCPPNDLLEPVCGRVRVDRRG